MQIAPFEPDQALRSPMVSSIPVSGADDGFGRLVDAAGDALEHAAGAEAAFAAGRGGLQEMVVSRTQADIALAIAASGAQRATQALNALLGMQI